MKGFNHFSVDQWMGDVIYKEKYIHTSFLGNLKIKGGQKLSGDILFYNIEKGQMINISYHYVVKILNLVN